MKNSILFIFTAILLIFTGFQANNADAIEGVWKSPDGKLMVKIDKMGTSYQGRIVWLSNPTAANGQPILDVNNPDVRMRKMPLKGKKIIEELTFDPSNNTWTGGSIYNPDTGKSLNCQAKLQNGGQLEIVAFNATPNAGQHEIWVKQD